MSIRVEYTKIKKYIEGVFINAGLSEEYAKTVTDNLLEAEIRGVRSHGLVQVKHYVDMIERGAIVKDAVPKIIKESPTTLLVDAGDCPGSVAGVFAMDKTIAKAKKSGIAITTVKNGTHFGMAAYYAIRSISENLIGFAFCNAGTIVAPFGGYSKELGTNPICVAVPAKDRLPLVYDGATSEAAFNKIFFAYTEEKDIPYGWALDEGGKPTNKPMEAMKGALLPFGAYKGYGLAVIVNVLTGILSGATIVQDADGKLAEDTSKVGYTFIAIDISKFQDIDEFKESIDIFIDRLKSSKRLEKNEIIYVPGEIEFMRKDLSLREGFEILGGVEKDLIDVGKRKGVKITLGDCAF